MQRTALEGYPLHADGPAGREEGQGHRYQGMRVLTSIGDRAVSGTDERQALDGLSRT